jgi:hypothetical protein
VRYAGVFGPASQATGAAPRAGARAWRRTTAGHGDAERLDACRPGPVGKGEQEMLTLRDERAGFDAIAVVRVGHDSTSAPTGVRTAQH